jgi:hypothetical protein
MFFEEWIIPILLVTFFSGLLIGLNIGIICGGKCGFHNSDVEIPRYVLRPENFPVRYPTSGNQNYPLKTPTHRQRFNY